MKWTTEQDRAGKLQGWLLATNTDEDRIELQYLQDDADGGKVCFANDGEAHRFVLGASVNGDALALAALAYLKEKSSGEYEAVLASQEATT